MILIPFCLHSSRLIVVKTLKSFILFISSISPCAVIWGSNGSFVIVSWRIWFSNSSSSSISSANSSSKYSWKLSSPRSSSSSARQCKSSSASSSPISTVCHFFACTSSSSGSCACLLTTACLYRSRFLTGWSSSETRLLIFSSSVSMKSSAIKGWGWVKESGSASRFRLKSSCLCLHLFICFLPVGPSPFSHAVQPSVLPA